MKKIKLAMLVVMTTISAYSYAQVGINTNNPQASLDVTGSPANASKLDGILPPRLTGDQLRAKTYTTAQTGAQVYVTAADSNPSGQTIYVKTPGSYYFNGTVWKLVLGVESVLPNGTGSVIMINGVIQVAQEMTMRMSQDWSVPVGTGNPAGGAPRAAIGNITTELVDNFNTFTGTATGNSFTVTNNGTYQVTMNFPVQNQNATTLSGNLYYGLFNVTDGVWQDFTIDTLSNLANGHVKNMSLTAAVDLVTGKTYAFYAGQQFSSYDGTNANLLIRGLSTSSALNFQLGYFAVKRIK